MLNHYFLVGLPPISPGEPLAITKADFLAQAASCLNDEIMAELYRLDELTALTLAIKNWVHNQAHGGDVTVTDHPNLWRRVYWQWLNNNSCSRLVRDFATEAVNFFEVLAALIAKEHHLAASHYQTEMCGPLDSTVAMIRDHYDEPDFRLRNRHAFLPALKEAVADANPIVLERFVQKYIFDLIDSMVSLDNFSHSHIYGYFLKIIFSESLCMMHQAHGQKVLDALLKSVQTGIYQ